ncbi:MAG: DMT family transporter [Gammaproteobacteria bacterium]|nr:DMT family transporter [Gammaproteobacteria bacterium]
MTNDRPGLGIVLMLGSAVLISCSDTVAKLMTREVSILQLSLVQGLVMMLLVPFIARTTRIRNIVTTGRPGLQAIRSVCIFISSITFYTGLKHLELVDVVAIIFVGPLIITALSALILKETVGARRWIACVVGFLGALVIIRPGFSDFGWEVVFPLLATSFYSIYVICTRIVAPIEPHSTLMFYSALFGVLILGLSAPLYWVSPDAMGWVGLLTVGFVSGASAALGIWAYALAPASLLAPYGYVEILTATLFGFLVFQHLPDGYTVLGAAIIVASGVYIFRGESR